MQVDLLLAVAPAPTGTAPTQITEKATSFEQTLQLENGKANRIGQGTSQVNEQYSNEPDAPPKQNDDDGAETTTEGNSPLQSVETIPLISAYALPITIAPQPVQYEAPYVAVPLNAGENLLNNGTAANVEYESQSANQSMLTLNHANMTITFPSVAVDEKSNDFIRAIEWTPVQNNDETTPAPLLTPRLNGDTTATTSDMDNLDNQSRPSLIQPDMQKAPVKNENLMEVQTASPTQTKTEPVHHDLNALNDSAKQTLPSMHVIKEEDIRIASSMETTPMNVQNLNKTSVQSETSAIPMSDNEITINANATMQAPLKSMHETSEMNSDAQPITDATEDDELVEQNRVPSNQPVPSTQNRTDEPVIELSNSNETGTLEAQAPARMTDELIANPKEQTKSVHQAEQVETKPIETGSTLSHAFSQADNQQTTYHDEHKFNHETAVEHATEPVNSSRNEPNATHIAVNVQQSTESKPSNALGNTIQVAANRSTEPVRTLEASERMAVIEQVSRHIAQSYQANQDKTITLRLDPPELGNIELTIHSQGRNVETAIVAEHEWVKHALNHSADRLKEMMFARGLNLTAFDVSMQNESYQRQEQTFFAPSKHSATSSHVSIAGNHSTHTPARYVHEGLLDMTA